MAALPHGIKELGKGAACAIAVLLCKAPQVCQAALEGGAARGADWGDSGSVWTPGVLREIAAVACIYVLSSIANASMVIRGAHARTAGLHIIIGLCCMHCARAGRCCSIQCGGRVAQLMGAYLAANKRSNKHGVASAGRCVCGTRPVTALADARRAACTRAKLLLSKHLAKKSAHEWQSSCSAPSNQQVSLARRGTRCLAPQPMRGDPHMVAGDSVQGSPGRCLSHIDVPHVSQLWPCATSCGMHTL